MRQEVTCPKCGSHEFAFFEWPVSLEKCEHSEAYARCTTCGWRSDNIIAPNCAVAFETLEKMLTPKRPRTIIDQLRAMSDEELAAKLAGSNVDTICDLCTDKHGACDAIGPHSDERCAERILAYLHTPLTEEKEETTMQELTLNEYQRLAQRTSNEEHDDFQTVALKKIDNGILGLCGETGECADIWKKSRHQGHNLDADKLTDECGDVLWYVAELAAGLGLTLEEVARRNIVKLEKRYPKGRFEAERSINREGNDNG